ncbi:MAG: hypothetical protein IPM53_13895 [Anaerolineaceae bacterium]|nr:hypothetical protein [Anaerolineaceae bacterium]
MEPVNSDSANKWYNQRLLAGCGVLFLIFFFGVAFGLVEIVQRDRTAVRYPGSTVVAAHSNYTSLPRSYNWDDTFRTDDGFHAVYQWYSITFDMGAESRANGACILLETDNKTFLVERFMSVTICGSPGGQLVFVDRTTRFK